MPPDHRQQVHQALFDPLELLREARHGLAELLEALALEARMIRHDLARLRARLDQSLRQGGAGIRRSLGDPLMMHEAPPATPLLPVGAALHRDLLPWAASSSGTPISAPSTSAVTSSRTNRLDRSGWRHSGLRCITSARSTCRPAPRSTCTCTAASGRCSGLRLLDAFTSITVWPRGVRSRMSTPT